MKTTEIIIKTNRLLLRQFVDTDVENFFKGLSHPKIIKHYGISFATIEAKKEQMTWFANLEKEGTGMWFAIYSLDNRTFYGAGGLNSLSKSHTLGCPDSYRGARFPRIEFPETSSGQAGAGYPIKPGQVMTAKKQL